MKAKAVAIVAAVVALAFVAWQAAAPLLTFNALADAARSGQPDRLERLVDFPAVRENLKMQLTDRLAGAIGRDDGLGRSPFGALGALLAPTLVNQIVEAAVTPAGIAAIVRSGRAPMSEAQPGKTALPPPPETSPPPPSDANPAPRKPKKTAFAYRDLNTFAATTTVGDAAPLTWVLERRNLVGWKLAAIELPPA